MCSRKARIIGTQISSICSRHGRLLNRRAANVTSSWYSRIGGQTNGRAHLARIVSWAFAEPGSTGCHHIRLPSQADTGRGNSAEAVMLQTVPQQLACGTSHHASALPIRRVPFCARLRSGDVRRSACREGKQPRTRRNIFAEQRSDNRSRAMDEKRPQISVASVTDPADTLLLPARMHPRSQPEPGRKVPCGLELTTVSHSCDDGTRSNRAYAGCSRKPAGSSLFLCHSTICRSTSAICSSSLSI